jgi:hypothetical protein
MALRWSALARRMHKGMTAVMLAIGVLVAASAISGCAGNGLGYGTYDTHGWTGGEGSYPRWEVETHRARRDFRRQDPGDTGGLLGLAPPVVAI